MTIWRVRQFITSWTPPRGALIGSGNIKDEAVRSRINLAFGDNINSREREFKVFRFTQEILLSYIFNIIRRATRVFETEIYYLRI